MTSESNPRKLLLVEGPDDEHVVQHIWKRFYGSDLPFHIRQTEGVNQLIRSIGVEVISPDRETVGILADANDDPGGRWNAIKAQLTSRGIQCPKTITQYGTIIDANNNGKPKVGIWLMPDHQTPGELENFIRELIPSEDSIWPQAVDFIEDIPQAHRKFSDTKTLKAQIHVWLATREKPRKMGAAIRTGDLKIDQLLAEKFCQWLHSLFA